MLYKWQQRRNVYFKNVDTSLILQKCEFLLDLWHFCGKLHAWKFIAICAALFDDVHPKYYTLLPDDLSQTTFSE